MKENKAFKHLCRIPERRMGLSDLSEANRDKVVSTAKYAMNANGESDQREVLKRCLIATLAEQYIAEWMQGHVMHGEEDLNDQWTYAFDVLSGPEYYGMRIEVKTHQSPSRYINVHTGHRSPYPGSQGLNIRPFLELRHADLIIVFDTKEDNGGWIFRPCFLSDVDSMLYDSVVVKSKFDGYYINQYISTIAKENLNIFCYNGLHRR